MDASAFSHEESCAFSKQGGVNPKHLDNISVPLDQVSQQDVLRIEPLTFFQEFCCVVFLGCVGPSAVVVLPLLALVVGYFLVGNVALTFRLLALALAPFLFLPQSFSPQALQSWMTHMIFKYFSYRMIWAKGTKMYIQQDEGPCTKVTETSARPQIYVAPPHGVYRTYIDAMLCCTGLFFLSRQDPPLTRCNFGRHDMTLQPMERSCRSCFGPY